MTISKPLVVMLSLTLAACQTRIDVMSVKASNFDRQPQRMLFVANLGAGLRGMRGMELAAAVEEAMKNCGVVASMEILQPPILGNPVAQRIQEFSPDAVTTIQWKTQTSGRNILAVNYDLELTDVPTKAVVWKAQMIVGGGADGNIYADTPQNFALALISRFKDDKIVSVDCPLPKAAVHY